MSGSGPSEVSSNLRVGTQIEARAKAILDSYDVKIGSTIMAPKRMDSKSGDLQLVTNIYGVETKHIPVYHYEISVFGGVTNRDGIGRMVELTGPVTGDAKVIERRSRCRDIVNLFLRANPEGFFKSGKCVYYDLKSILFTLERLQLNEEHGATLKLEGKDLPKDLYNYDSCMIRVRGVKHSEIMLDEFNGISNDLSKVTRTLDQFLDIATSQYAMFHPEEHITFSANTTYLLTPAKYMRTAFNETISNDRGAFLGYGAQKGVRFIEGPRGVDGIDAALVVESKKTPFHGVEPVVNKAKLVARDWPNIRGDDFRKLEQFLRGLHVVADHAENKQYFDIKAISPESARTKKIIINDDEVTVEQYFKTKYNRVLQEPTIPLLITDGRDGKRFFPMEVCTVVDNQRVTTAQQSPMLVQSVIRGCALPPHVLRAQTEESVNSLHLHDSEHLRAAEITVSKNPITVRARQLPPPTIEFGDSRARVNEKFNFVGKRYLRPAKCTVWAAYGFLSESDKRKVSRDEFVGFLKRYVNEANASGVEIGKPTDMQMHDATVESINTVFKKAAEADCEFILTLHSDKADDVHCAIKYAERQQSIVSQCIRFQTFKNMTMKGQPQTLQNIVNKTNMKLGGLNYSILGDMTSDLLDPSVLYIGTGINHPGGGFGPLKGDDQQQGGYPTETTSSSPRGSVSGSDKTHNKSDKLPPPTVVGYAATMGKHPFEFIGDFVFQDAQRDEKVNVIALIVERCVWRFSKTRGHPPSKIILYRGGCSEGHFAMVLKYEVPLLKLALKESGCNAPITVIVANKLQNIRFFKQNINPRERPPEQNIQPGTVIDRNVVHPKFFEFFLNSHRALQGTARTPKYTVLFDENNFSLEKLEGMTYGLTYGHQIVNMPTSLPSPIYIANCYAERGRDLVQCWCDQYRIHSYTALTDELCFFNDEYLASRRVNA